MQTDFVGRSSVAETDPFSSTGFTSPFAFTISAVDATVGSSINVASTDFSKVSFAIAVFSLLSVTTSSLGAALETCLGRI